jgi:hypothetical protein
MKSPGGAAYTGEPGESTAPHPVGRGPPRLLCGQHPAGLVNPTPLPHSARKEDPHDPEHIGFIGTGLMGHGMAKNIVEKGYPLTVTAHRNRAPVDDL